MAKASRVAAQTANKMTGMEERLGRIEDGLAVLLTLAGKPEEALKLGPSPVLPVDPSPEPLEPPKTLLKKKSR